MTRTHANIDFLFLPDVKTIRVYEHVSNYHVVATSTLTPTAPCDHCQSVAWKPWGYRNRQLVDSPKNYLACFIKIERQRFRCAVCETGITDAPLPSAHGQSQLTARAVANIRRMRHRSIAEIAAEHGTSPRTISSIRKSGDLLAPLPVPTTPQILGLDGVFIGKRCRTVATDVQRRLFFDLLPTPDHGDDLVRFLKDLVGVQAVVIDFKDASRKAVRIAMPQTAVIADRFHFTKIVNDCADKARRALFETRNKKQPINLGKLDGESFRALFLRRRHTISNESVAPLEIVLAQSPRLRRIYDLKESVLNVWNMRDKAEAAAAFTTWENSLSALERRDYRRVIRLLKSWDAEILNFFTFRFTNGFTESLNRRLKEWFLAAPNLDIAGIKQKGYAWNAARFEKQAAQELRSHKNSAAHPKNDR